jgi:hypothetical protein
MNAEFENRPVESMDEPACPAMSYQDVTVCVPVTIKPYGQVGNVKVQCLGQPVVRTGGDMCPGCEEGVCQFTISQKLKVQVPVFFGARAEAGKASVDCGRSGCEDCCHDNPEEPEE